MSVVYDAGLLVAADRNDRGVWADHRSRLELGVIPITTAPVVAQVSRTARQVQLRRLLRGCNLIDFTSKDSHEVGDLLSRSGSSDVVDAHVVLTAARSASTVLTDDDDDLSRLSNCLAQPVILKQVQNPKRRR